MSVRSTITLLLILFCSTSFAASDQNLPTLGDHTSGIISLEQERELGQDFLKSIRSQAPLVTDPVLQEYLELLIYRLASHSQLTDRRIDLAIIDNKTINAFAAPGGIVGINLGLFLFGETESEISAILAHEIAHLSQRHFARRSEAGKKSGVTSLIGVLAGVALMATAGTDAGLAALTASQALTQSEMLRYSRSRETEADRVGIETLKEADMNPRAMAHMFERLNRANRFSGHDIPEFLRTHPVTKNRISDSYTQVETLPASNVPTSLDFQMMRAKIQVMTASNTSKAIGIMKDKMKSGDPIISAAARYGLALAQTEAGQIDASRRNINSLRTQYPGKIAFIIAEAELYLKSEQYDSAVDLLADELRVSPDNYPLSFTYASALMSANRPRESADLLRAMTVQRPNDKDIWYILAEAEGLAQDIVGVHTARAEYFVLVGNFKQAIKQLSFATPLVRHNFQQNARVQQRMDEVIAMLQKNRRR